MGRPKIPFEEKYIPEPNSGCWLWTSYWDNKGYGIMSYGRKAHRESFELYVGPIPDGYYVCHKCDTPCCVNPNHLFIGTTQENTKDRHSKGRSARGERSGPAKLTEEQVREIRISKESSRSLCKKYGVSYGLIGHIRRGRVWTHVKI